MGLAWFSELLTNVFEVKEEYKQQDKQFRVSFLYSTFETRSVMSLC